MYSLLLALHSLLRWLVLLVAIMAIVRGLAGWSGRRLWLVADDRAGRFFTMTLDLQALVGFILYFALSPVTTEALRDFGSAMSIPVTRYWAVEHLTMMILVLALAHVGRARSRKSREPVAKHRNAAIFYGIALLLLLLSIPWPFSRIGRPLLPLG